MPRKHHAARAGASIIGDFARPRRCPPLGEPPTRMSPDLWKFLQQNIFLVAIALVSGAMLIWPLLRRGVAGASVDTLQATLLINKEDAVVLDVREPAEFAAGRIAHARNVPLAQLGNRLGELEKLKDRPVIVSCASGNRSLSAAGTLRKHGFTKVYSLAGGMGAWVQAGLPVEKK
jgi:rhodanese-related sulfurtransferase